jgi:hypothetical protein
MIRLLAGEIATWRRRPEIVVASLAVLVIVAALWISGYLSSQAAAASLPASPGRAGVPCAISIAGEHRLDRCCRDLAVLRDLLRRSRDDRG